MNTIKELASPYMDKKEQGILSRYHQMMGEIFKNNFYVDEDGGYTTAKIIHDENKYVEYQVFYSMNQVARIEKLYVLSYEELETILEEDEEPNLEDILNTQFNVTLEVYTAVDGNIMEAYNNNEEKNYVHSVFTLSDNNIEEFINGRDILEIVDELHWI